MCVLSSKQAPSPTRLSFENRAPSHSNIIKPAGLASLCKWVSPGMSWSFAACSQDRPAAFYPAFISPVIILIRCTLHHLANRTEKKIAQKKGYLNCQSDNPNMLWV
jgi:hypothetical protein